MAPEGESQDAQPPLLPSFTPSSFWAHECSPLAGLQPNFPLTLPFWCKEPLVPRRGSAEAGAEAPPERPPLRGERSPGCRGSPLGPISSKLLQGDPRTTDATGRPQCKPPRGPPRGGQREGCAWGTQTTWETRPAAWGVAHPSPRHDPVHCGHVPVWAT